MPLPAFQSRFEIADRPVGGDAPCLIIAEAGVGHFGDVALGLDLVDLAAHAGADVFKTQIFDVDELISADLPDWRDRLRPRNLPFEGFAALKQRCDEHGLLFMATSHDEAHLDWLERLDVPAIKVGSGERNNPLFLQRLAELGRPMVVSTGMYAEADVLEALEACALGGCERVALLHCVTSYPAAAEDINLAAMDRLAELFEGPVGYSDHAADDLALLAAVARGAQVVEKHITLPRGVPNAQDWKASAGPEDLQRLIERIRRVEAMIGHGRKEPAAAEKAGEQWALKSVVAARDLAAGQELAREDLVAKRPGTGLPANRLSGLIGRRLARPVAADSQIGEDDLAA